MKILLAVDGSPYTKKMLAYLAVHELFSPKNEYTALTVQLMLPTQARTALGKELVTKYYEDEGQRILDRYSRKSIEDDLKRARRITYESWKARPWREKVLEHASALLSSQL